MNRYDKFVSTTIDFAKIKIKRCPFDNRLIYLDATGLSDRSLTLYQVGKSLLMIGTGLCGICQTSDTCPGPLATTEIGNVTLYSFKDHRKSGVISNETMPTAAFCSVSKISELQRYGKCQQTTLPEN